MKIEAEKYTLRIIPENEMEEVYLESLGFCYEDSTVTAKRSGFDQPFYVEISTISWGDE